jgi:tRNA A37 methylthiotransferase MiaB
MQRPGLVIGVGGCVASQEGETLRERAPCVDLVFGPQTLHRLPEMLTAVWADRQPVVDVSFPEIEKFDRLPEPRAVGPTAFVSIMEGCSKYCTFCVVPYTRVKKSVGLLPMSWPKWRPWRRRECAKSPARPECQRLSRAARMAKSWIWRC